MPNLKLKEEMKLFTKKFKEDNNCKNTAEINDGYCGDFAYLLNAHLEERGFPMFAQLSFYDFIVDGFKGLVEEDTAYWDINKMIPYGISKDDFEQYRAKLLKIDKRGYVGYHVWLYDGEKHYDSQCLDGVLNPLDLPFFQIFIR